MYEREQPAEAESSAMEILNIANAGQSKLSWAFGIHLGRYTYFKRSWFSMHKRACSLPSSCWRPWQRRPRSRVSWMINHIAIRRKNLHPNLHFLHFLDCLKKKQKKKKREKKNNFISYHIINIYMRKLTTSKKDVSIVVTINDQCSFFLAVFQCSLHSWTQSRLDFCVKSRYSREEHLSKRHPLHIGLKWERCGAFLLLLLLLFPLVVCRSSWGSSSSFPGRNVLWWRWGFNQFHRCICDPS